MLVTLTSGQAKIFLENIHVFKLDIKKLVGSLIQGTTLQMR